MRFVVDFEPAGPTGGVRVTLNGTVLASTPIPAEAGRWVGEAMVLRYGEALAESRQHAPGEPCDICNGTGTDYLGRDCRRLKIASR